VEAEDDKRELLITRIEEIFCFHHFHFLDFLDGNIGLMRVHSLPSQTCITSARHDLLLDLDSDT